MGDPFNYHNDDVWYRASDDEGATWSDPVSYTMYAGPDIMPNVAGFAGGGFGLVWESLRRTGSDYTQE